ncbi:Wzz/FepE/Etk N-terminal domain-containing protein [Bradyrhizobium sp. Ec3.3]|uniref:Wzz/FepE/Etk N-terminal domain-containing protein n=1 Tax=Bradyrhizobium sp. Ec3.3 TaxID=189753 RepID=UPI000A02C496|nr:Wzz/FepE/Etk N-terminal domain-containing protein [Bradyrhizobium sp. Ec3.3]
MLQNNRTDNWISRDNRPPEFRPGPVVSLAEVLAVLAFMRRHLPIILLTCFAALGVAAVYLVTAVPTFTAKALIIVNSRASLADAAAVSTVVESQVGIIKSESIASAVIEKLGLAQDPEFATGQGMISISRMLGWTKPETEASAARHALEPFERKLSVKRVGPTYLVEITFDSRDPDRAAQIANAVAERYITPPMDRASWQDDKWVKDRLNELSTQALAAQKALEDYGKDRKEPADSAATIDKLAAAAELSKKAYDNFRHVLRKTEATQQQSSPVFEANLVSAASPPLRASSPKPRIVLGIAIVGGLLLGIAVAVLRDLLARGVRASGPEHRLSTEEGRIERMPPDMIRPDHQSEASAKATPVRLTGSG